MSENLRLDLSEISGVKLPPHVHYCAACCEHNFLHRPQTPLHCSVNVYLLFEFIYCCQARAAFARCFRWRPLEARDKFRVGPEGHRTLRLIWKSVGEWFNYANRVNLLACNRFGNYSPKTLSSSINNSEKEKQWNRFSSFPPLNVTQKLAFESRIDVMRRERKLSGKISNFHERRKQERKSRAKEDEVKCKMIFLSHPNMTEITAKTTRRRWKFKLRFIDCSKLNSRQQADVVKCSLDGCREQIIKIIMKWVREGDEMKQF